MPAATFAATASPVAAAHVARLVATLSTAPVTGLRLCVRAAHAPDTRSSWALHRENVHCEHTLLTRASVLESL